MKFGVLYVIMALSNIANACTCDPEYWCDYLHNEGDYLVCLVEPLEHLEDENGNLITHLRVIKTFRDDVGATEVIALIGNDSEAWCMTDVHQQFPIGEQSYLAINTIYEAEYESSELTNTTNWHYAPHLCYKKIVRIYDDLVYSNALAPNDISRYPLDKFEDHFEDCDYNYDELTESFCKTNDYQIVPNPSTGTFAIENTINFTTINKVEIYNSNGQVVWSQQYKVDGQRRLNVEVNIDLSGLYLVRIFCGDEVHVEKVVFR